jgi:Ca2+-binding EF-hand superfamily protein
VAELSEERINELREAFVQADADWNGRIRFGEFMKLLEDLESDISREEARVGFAALDTDRDGSIGFEEFLAWLSQD